MSQWPCEIRSPKAIIWGLRGWNEFLHNSSVYTWDFSQGFLGAPTAVVTPPGHLFLECVFLVHATPCTCSMRATRPPTRKMVLNFCTNHLLNSALTIIFGTAWAQAYDRPEAWAKYTVSYQCNWYLNPDPSAAGPEAECKSRNVTQPFLFFPSALTLWHLWSWQKTGNSHLEPMLIIKQLKTERSPRVWCARRESHSLIWIWWCDLLWWVGH